MSEPERFEVLILGSGQGGNLLAWYMARLGGGTAVVERRWIGGSCPNIACLPSKNEIRMADLDGEFYLSRINCEFYDVLDHLCREHGANLSAKTGSSQWWLPGCESASCPNIQSPSRVSLGARSYRLRSRATSVWSASPAVAGHRRSQLS
jgi:hypothetical protein